MLEERDYTLAELEKELKVSGRQNLKEKLDRWEVEYEITGRGSSAVFQIKRIQNPFKVFCLQETKFLPQTDFNNLCYFIYKYLTDDDFATVPMEDMAERMKAAGFYVNRVTVGKWVGILKKSCRLIAGELRYHLSQKKDGKRITKEITEEEYNAFWRRYFAEQELGKTKDEAMGIAKYYHGGVPYKAITPACIPWDTENIEKCEKLVQYAVARLRALEEIEANT